MAVNEIVQVVEIDIDYCTRTFGVGVCQAALGAGTPRKCYQTYQTCGFKSAFNKSTLTLKFIEKSKPVKGGGYIPALSKVGGYDQTVNIAGFGPLTNPLGQRASVQVEIEDFPYNDALTDKYMAGRMDGSAQIDEAGYNTLTRGSFWTKFKARVPNYAGRPLRAIQAHYAANGTLVYDKVRSYVMDEINGPDRAGMSVTIKAKDVLSLADNNKALAPAASSGRLFADITADDTSARLTPPGSGAAYPASGMAVIGSEVVAFTRSGDNLTLTREQRGTAKSAHNSGDTFQIALTYDRVRADTVIRDLLVNYGNIPASYITFSDWQSEFNQWGSKMFLSATICKPTSVVQLLGEITQLGITVWWDELSQKVRIKLNHPPTETPVEWSDRNNIIDIKQEDNDDERATRVEFWTVQIDPTKDLSSENFSRGWIAISVDSESPNMFGLPRTKQIFCRWLNHGDDSAVKIISGRLLNRYKRAPVTYSVKIDAKDDPSLTDVISLNSQFATDITGKPTPTLTQVYYRADDRNGVTVNAKLQMFQFDARYGKIAPNNYPKYGSATEAQKLHGSFFVGPTLVFADGQPAYQFV